MKKTTLKGLLVIVLGSMIAATISAPAYAQRVCSGISAATISRKAPAAAQVGGVKAQVYAVQPPLATVVNGGGVARLTDPDGQTFSVQFGIGVMLRTDGSAQGQVNFVFPLPFSLKWGALPGISELIHLQGEMTTGSVPPSGDIEITGQFVETDYNRSDGIVYQEDSRVTGVAPLRIVVSAAPGSERFTLAWCSFIPPGGTGSFSVEVDKGTLKIHR